MKEDEAYTLKEAADLLGVSYVTALRYIKLKHLAAFRRGGQWRVKPEEVERFKREGNLRRDGETDED